MFTCHVEIITTFVLNLEASVLRVFSQKRRANYAIADKSIVPLCVIKPPATTWGLFLANLGPKLTSASMVYIAQPNSAEIPGQDG